MGAQISELISGELLTSVRKGANDRAPISGLTHRFYRYPARFSPSFVASAIEAFSRPGDVVLDPYMGGGTSIVEAMARGRRAVGCDLNSLAVFVTSAKTAVLSEDEVEIVRKWANVTVANTSYQMVTDKIADLICPQRTRNLNLPRARPAKKLLAQCILALSELPSEPVKAFCRCVLLNVGQWALNNKKVAPTLAEIRARISVATQEMLLGLDELSKRLRELGNNIHAPTLLHASSVDLPQKEPFVSNVRADLVVTSPPYPGIHILYHRWQVDGRKETAAPYWIASCVDGEGSAFYNFADRSEDAEEEYFEESLRTLKSIRRVTRQGAMVVQMIAFSRPRTQLAKYLRNMRIAGFTEVREEGESRPFRRIWRQVPGRAWYANLKGRTSSSREVVLIHRAV